MKTFLAIGFGLALSQAAVAQDTVTVPVEKALPTLPADCLDQVSSNVYPYCKSSTINGDKVSLVLAAVVDIANFPATEDRSTVQNLISRYLDFTAWPAFVAASDKAVIEFKAAGSKGIAGKQAVPVKGVGAAYTHQYDYSMKVQGIPLLKTAVSGTTVNTLLDVPFEGAAASLVFAADKGGKGVKTQTGSLHAVSCESGVYEFCDAASQILVIYETTAQPDISFAMKIAADTVTAGIEDLLIGMLDPTVEAGTSVTLPAPAAE